MTTQTWGQKSWREAFAEVRRSMARHKARTAVAAAVVAASLAAIGWAGTAHSGPGTPPPQPAAAFRLPALGQEGASVSLSQYAGKPLIVNFFASWCTPCQKETPLLAHWYRTEHGAVALVGLDENDQAGPATAFVSKEGVSYPVGWDPGVLAGSAYGVAALPQTFFLDARHRVVYRVFGAVTTADLRKGIALAIHS